MKPVDIVFLGTHGQYNLGDELLLETFLKQLGPKHRYTVNTYDKAFTAAQLGDRYDVTVVDTAGDRRLFLKQLRSCDLVVFGGGSIIKELYKSTGRNPYGTLLMILAVVTFAKVVARKPIAMLNIGVGPIATKKGRLLARCVLQQVDLISVRDERSYQTCLDVGLKSASLTQATDAVFSLDAHWLRTSCPSPSAEIDATSEPEQEATKVAINLNFDIQNPQNWDYFLETLAAALVEVHRRQPIELHALPMQVGFKTNDDATVLQKFAEMVPGIKMHHHSPATYGEAARIIESCDVLLSERLHAIIMASILGVPTFALAYDVKVAELATMLDIEDYSVDINTRFSQEEVTVGLVKMIENSADFSARLRNRSRELGVTAQSNFDATLAWVENATKR